MIQAIKDQCNASVKRLRRKQKMDKTEVTLSMELCIWMSQLLTQIQEKSTRP